MMIRLLYAAVLTAWPMSTFAHTTPVEASPAPAVALPSAPAVAVQPKPATVLVRIETAMGAIVLELEKERAPITTANFLRYVDSKRLDGAVFYRAVTFPALENYGLIQGGLQNSPAKWLPPIKHEPTTQTGLTHKTEGTISLARLAPGTATAEFFITLGNMSSLDANPAASGDNQGFAAFGRVIEGMDVVKSILKSPISQTTKADHPMKGQMIAAPVKMISVKRVPATITKP